MMRGAPAMFLTHLSSKIEALEINKVHAPRELIHIAQKHVLNTTQSCSSLFRRPCSKPVLLIC